MERSLYVQTPLVGSRSPARAPCGVSHTGLRMIQTSRVSSEMPPSLREKPICSQPQKHLLCSRNSALKRQCPNTSGEHTAGEGAGPPGPWGTPPPAAGDRHEAQGHGDASRVLTGTSVRGECYNRWDHPQEGPTPSSLHHRGGHGSSGGGSRNVPGSHGCQVTPRGAGLGQPEQSPVLSGSVWPLGRSLEARARREEEGRLV